MTETPAGGLLSDIMDNHQLAARVIAKRGDKGLRATAAEIGGISASTLSRVETGNVPDLDTFLRLCRWLEASPEEFTGGPPLERPGNEQAQRVEVIAAHLRADRTLDRATARALEHMVRLAYEAAAAGRLVDEDGE